MEFASRLDWGMAGHRRSGGQAFLVVNYWESRPDAPEEGAFTTEPFVVDRGPWAIVWALRGDWLQVRLRPACSRPCSPCWEALNLLPGGRGIVYINEPGTFSLEVASAGDWVVKVAVVEDLSLVGD